MLFFLACLCMSDKNDFKNTKSCHACCLSTRYLEGVLPSLEAQRLRTSNLAKIGEQGREKNNNYKNRVINETMYDNQNFF